MKEEPLTKTEWIEFLDNHWKHMCIDVAGIKTDIKWIKWFLCLIVAGVVGIVGYIIRNFFTGI